MTRLGNYELRKTISSEEFDYVLLTNTLSGYSGIQQKINELLKADVIIRVKKGLYVFGPSYNQAAVCKEVLANLIYGPSCISLEYALAYHGLIPERVETITSVTPKRNKEFNTPLGRFTYRYLASDKYVHGIEQVWIDHNHPVLMACPEKALCDYIVLNKVPDIVSADAAEEFLEADLRIDQHNWKQFNAGTLRKLNKFYCNQSIEHIQEIL